MESMTNRQVAKGLIESRLGPYEKLIAVVLESKLEKEFPELDEIYDKDTFLKAGNRLKDMFPIIDFDSILEELP